MRTVGIGFYWNDLKAGEKFRTLNRTITDADIVQFIGVTGMVETIFTDLSFGDHHGAIKGRVSPAALVYTIIEGLLCQATMQTTGPCWRPSGCTSPSRSSNCSDSAAISSARS